MGPDLDRLNLAADEMLSVTRYLDLCGIIINRQEYSLDLGHLKQSFCFVSLLVFW